MIQSYTFQSKIALRYIYIYIRTYMDIYIYIYIYTCKYIYISNLSIYLYVCIYIQTGRQANRQTDIDHGITLHYITLHYDALHYITYTYLDIRIHIYIYICIHNIFITNACVYLYNIDYALIYLISSSIFLARPDLPHHFIIPSFAPWLQDHFQTKQNHLCSMGFRRMFR